MLNLTQEEAGALVRLCDCEAQMSDMEKVTDESYADMIFSIGLRLSKEYKVTYPSGLPWPPRCHGSLDRRHSDRRSVTPAELERLRKQLADE